MKKYLFFLIMPAFLISCKHEACDDGIKNQDETGVDCGGICKACPSCTDGILNQSEIDIDCGGECNPCETCNDGIKNQDEVDVDCGGVCDPCLISYPATGGYGLNILHGDDTLYLTSDYYSMTADVPEGSSLLIKLTQVSGGVWYYSLGLTGAWTVGAYGSGQQLFEATSGSINNDLKISLSQMTGTFVVWYYENSTTAVAKTKIVVVQ